MTRLDRAADRYQNDATYRAIVTTLQSIVLSLEMTPGELREACMFACLLVEEKRCRPMVIVRNGRVEHDHDEFARRSSDTDPEKNR